MVELIYKGNTKLPIIDAARDGFPLVTKRYHLRYIINDGFWRTNVLSATKSPSMGR